MGSVHSECGSLPVRGMNLDGQQGLASNAMPKAVNSSSDRKKRVQGRCWDLMEDLDVQVPLEAPRGDPPGSYRQIAESSVAVGLVAPPSASPSQWSPGRGNDDTE